MLASMVGWWRGRLSHMHALRRATYSRGHDQAMMMVGVQGRELRCRKATGLVGRARSRHRSACKGPAPAHLPLVDDRRRKSKHKHKHIHIHIHVHIHHDRVCLDGHCALAAAETACSATQPQSTQCRLASTAHTSYNQTSPRPHLVTSPCSAPFGTHALQTTTWTSPRTGPSVLASQTRTETRSSRPGIHPQASSTGR